MLRQGDVYKIPFAFPGNEAVDRLAPEPKYVIVLNDDPITAGSNLVAVAVASTKTHDLRPFEALLGVDDGFDHDTVVDGRWVFTISTTRLDHASFKFALSETRMWEISRALARGLQFVLRQPGT